LKAGTAGSGDYYAVHVASDEYRDSRREKADVILHLIGDQLEAARWAADIGTGTGIMKQVLEEKSGKYIVGFEIDIPFVVDRGGVVGGDATVLPVKDGTFDVVILNHLYEHVDDPGALFREAYRVLRVGGVAYVSAGSRWGIIEPHYRLPFLSWLPRRASDAYLRLSGRGTSYDGVGFLGYANLTGLMRSAGFGISDVTERALSDLLGPARGRRWQPAWTVLRALPSALRRWVLRGSPQWFFVLERTGEMETSRDGPRLRGISDSVA